MGKVRRNRRQAVVRRESADTLENEAMSHIPNPVSRTAGWHEPKFMCDRQCRMEGFKYNEIASVQVEDDSVLHKIKPHKKLLRFEARREGGEDKLQAMAKPSR